MTATTWQELPEGLRQAIDGLDSAAFDAGEWDARWSEGTWEECYDAVQVARNVLVAEIVKALEAAKEEGVAGWLTAHATK